MADTYTQLYIHLVFAVKYRQSLIHESFRDELEKYMCGIASEKRHKPLAIYCMPDHIHLFVGLNPAEAISTLVRDLKTATNTLINEKQWVAGRFQWQEGYGAFSHARSQLDTVVRYIRNQPNHHQKQRFRDEYLDMLQKAGIDFQPQYLFDWLDEPLENVTTESVDLYGDSIKTNAPNP